VLLLKPKPGVDFHFNSTIAIFKILEIDITSLLCREWFRLDEIWKADAKSCRKTANTAQCHFGDVLESDIIFCDICRFRSASWQMSSLKGVVNC